MVTGYYVSHKTCSFHSTTVKQLRLAFEGMSSAIWGAIEAAVDVSVRVIISGVVCRNYDSMLTPLEICSHRSPKA